MRAATALLDAGASANTGFWEVNHQPKPEWESVLYGAAGVAHHPEVTQLLLERGADPNDEETPYHAPETYNNAALKVLVESGKVNDDSLATMLLRKADWHDRDGIAFLLNRGADPNRMTRWHFTALHQALRRDNDLTNIELLLDHGADPTLANGRDGKSAIAIAARRGRGDVLASFERRGIRIGLHGVERLIAACARNNAAQVSAIAEREPQLVSELFRGRDAARGICGDGEHGRYSAPPRPGRESGRIVRGRRCLLRHCEEQHSATRGGVACRARDCQVPHRKRRADRRTGWKGTHASGACGSCVCRFVLGV